MSQKIVSIDSKRRVATGYKRSHSEDNVEAF
jgi:hypothetical protein